MIGYLILGFMVYLLLGILLAGSVGSEHSSLEWEDPVPTPRMVVRVVLTWPLVLLAAGIANGRQRG